MAEKETTPLQDISGHAGNAWEANASSKAYKELSNKQQAQSDIYNVTAKDMYENAMNRYDDTASRESAMWDYSRKNKQNVMDDQMGQLRNQSALASKFGQQGMDSASMQMAQQGAQRAASYGASGGEDARSALAGAQSAQRTLTDAYTGIASNDAQMRQQNQQNMLSQQNNLTGQMAGAQNQFYDWSNESYGKNVLNPQYNKSNIEFGRSDMFQNKGDNLQGAQWENMINQKNAKAQSEGEWIKMIGSINTGK